MVDQRKMTSINLLTTWVRWETATGVFFLLFIVGLFVPSEFVEAHPWIAALYVLVIMGTGYTMGRGDAFHKEIKRRQRGEAVHPKDGE